MTGVALVLAGVAGGWIAHGVVERVALKLAIRLLTSSIGKEKIREALADWAARQ